MYEHMLVYIHVHAERGNRNAVSRKSMAREIASGLPPVGAPEADPTPEAIRS